MSLKFFYKAKNSQGKTVTGIIESSDEYEAEMALLEQGLNILTLRASNIFDQLNEKFELLKEKLSPVSLMELIVFTRQFSTLYSAGIPVITALQSLHGQILNPKFKKIIKEIIQDVQAGTSLYFAFHKHEEIFTPLYVGMIKVGEEGGVLDIILQRIASILETQLENEKRIKAATRYPKLVIISIISAFVILLTFVIPKFVSLFARFHAKLPLPTRILIWMNYAFHHYWWIVLIICIVIYFGYKKIRKTEKGKLETDKLILKIPIIGNLISKIYIARIVRILGLLYRSGIPIITGFEIVSAVTNNEHFKKEILKIRNSISLGSSINVAIRGSSVFPPIVSDMIEAGEDTGMLDDMLFKVAEYFEEESDYIIQNLSSAIEPILLLFVAGMILIVALGVFLPMWSMMNVFKG